MGSKLESEDFDNVEKGEAAISRHEDEYPPQMSPVQEFAAVALLSMAQFSTQIGVGQTLAILHIIGDSFGVQDPGKLSWYMAAYSLTVGTFILPAGRFGDVFGHKHMLLIGFSWFSLWTLVAGLSVYSNSILFTIARALQGIGPSICLPNGLAVLGSLYRPSRRKDIVFSIFGATAPLGSVVGAVFGSLFALAWWPWAYFSFAIVLAVTAALIFAVIPCSMEPIGKKLTLSKKISNLDPLGSFIGVLGLVFFNFAWNQAPISQWDSPLVLVFLIIGIGLIVAFFMIEKWYASYPIIPLNTLKGDVALVLACEGLGWSCFGIWLYYTWQFFEQLRLASPLHASAWYSTNGISGALAAILTGMFLRRIGPAPAMFMALLAYLIGVILIATSPVDQIYWTQTFLCLVILPFGMDISFPAGTVLISDFMPREHQGLAASLVNTVVNYSISLGLGFAGTAEVQVRKGDDSPEGLLRGYRAAWYVAMGLSGLGVLVSLFYWITFRTKKSSFGSHTDEKDKNKETT